MTEEPSIFSINISVQPDDLDELNHVNNVVYLRWAQDAAAAHWRGVAGDSLLSNFIWVVLRHEIDYKKPAKLGDDIVASTWVRDYDGARSTRIVQLKRRIDDVLLAEAKTTWCLLDARTSKLVRIGPEIKTVFMPETI